MFVPSNKSCRPLYTYGVPKTSSFIRLVAIALHHLMRGTYASGQHIKERADAHRAPKARKAATTT